MSPLILSDAELAERLRQLARECFNPANKFSEAEWCGRIIKILEKLETEEYDLLRRSLFRD